MTPSVPKTTATEWFSEWFDSPYYHILYKNRNEAEAEMFIDNICQLLALPPQARLLDVACGKGRHARYLSKKGYNVIGTDLAAASIQYAQQFENQNLKFEVQDMRTVYKPQYFDGIFNFFTSFGYFETDSENQQAIAAIAQNLKPKGLFVLDFMNTHKVIQDLVQQETKIVENIQFRISRKVQNGFILKDIAFEDEQQTFQFQEKVMAISLGMFEQYFNNNQLKIRHLFGNYALQPFDLLRSDRMIFVLELNTTLA